MLRKNEERTDIVSCIGVNGEGVIKTEDGTVFVPYALPGEKVRYRVLKVTSKCAYGKALEILTPAEERVRPKCPVFAKCGGCNLQHLKYTEQLVVKSNSVAVCFKKIAGIDVEIKPAVRGDNEFRYRNKLQLPVGDGENGPQIGFYAENSHRIIEIDDCLINALWTENLIKAFKSYMLQAGLKGYNEQTLSGDVREITAKEIKDKLIIVVVSTKRNLPRLDLLTELLKQEIKMKFSLFINYNPKPTNVIYGEEFFCVCGQKSYGSEMLGVKYDTGVLSFMQVNRSVCSKLYSAVSQAVAADENSTVIDAYSGAGVLTAILAKKAKKVIGIEIVKEAVSIADSVAKKNKLSDKITNYCASCEEILPSIVARERANGAKITVVLDPPRKGCDIRVIRSLIKNDIDKIVYVSCKPSTLARDVGLLVGTLQEENGEIKRSNNFQPRYKIDEIKTYDMFAQTKHVETLVLLSHKKPDGHIGVTVEFGEEDGQVSLADIEKRAKERAPKKKTTYKDIQSYIEDKYGFKVHTAYIAEVKRDLGLPMYDAPNAVEELKRPRSHPTTEMVEAIKDALKHFEII